MATENKTNHLPSVRVTPGLFEQVEALRSSKRLKLSDTVRFIVEQFFAADDWPPVSPADKTEEAELRDRKLRAEVEDRERKNAVALGELTSRAVFMAEVEKAFAQIRQRIQQISIDGMTDEQRDQLDKAKEDCMTDLSAGLKSDV